MLTTSRCRNATTFKVSIFDVLEFLNSLKYLSHFIVIYIHKSQDWKDHSSFFSTFKLLVSIVFQIFTMVCTLKLVFQRSFSKKEKERIIPKLESI